MASEEFWSDPERVEEFARREPDQRLSRLVEGYADPAATRVVDVGCAGGRNTRFLVERGFDTWALDTSEAMVERTRLAIAPICGEEEARRRVLHRGMEDLSFLDEGSVDLVVALGVFQMAPSDEALHGVMADTARILSKPGGRLLVAVFAPGTRLDGADTEHVAGTRYVHRAADGRPVCMLTAAELDACMADHGLSPEEPTEMVERERKGSLRVVTNGLYGIR